MPAAGFAYAILLNLFSKPYSGIILSGALTLRVTAFVVLSPLAGVIADRFDRKLIMVITHLSRMVIVCLLPFVTQAWQIYAIVLALNVFYAFFTPTYRTHLGSMRSQPWLIF